MKSCIGRTCAWLVALALIFPTATVASALMAPPFDAEQKDKGKDQDKAEKERKKQEEKSSAKELRDQKEAKDILAEVQTDIDDLAKIELAKTYADRFLQDYVNQLGQSLIPKETPAGLLFSFRVIDDWEPNAFALPDGRIYVNAGLLAFVQNEAQLSVVLGHEIGHVIQGHYIESVKASRSFTRGVLPGLIGAAAGAAIGGATKGKEGAAVGAAIGLGAGAIYSIVTMNAYSRKQEDEADRMGVTLAMNGGFDPKESAGLFQKLADEFGEQDRLSALLWASHSRNVERIKTVNALLDGQLSSGYNAARSAGNLTIGGGELKLYMSRMIRDVAIRAIAEDRYRLAKTLLDGIVDYRARDPKTLWAAGLVYKMVGRTATDKSKALEYLQGAARIDERGMYPFINRDLGLMEARLGPGQMPAAIDSLKKYVLGHIAKNGVYPPDIEEMYDYLLIFGDSKWTAPRVDPVIIRAANPTPEPGSVQPTPPPAGATKPPTRGTPGNAVRPPVPGTKKPGGRGGQS